MKLVENILGLTRALLTQLVTPFSSYDVDDARINSRLSVRVQPCGRKLLALVLGVYYFRWSNKQQQQLHKHSSLCLTHEIYSSWCRLQFLPTKRRCLP